MRTSAPALVLLVLWMGLFPRPAAADVAFDLQALLPIDTWTADLFAIDGHIAVYGDRTAHVVRVFQRTGTDWALVQTIPAPAGAVSFPGAVAIDGTTILATALAQGGGGYVYEHDGAAWTLRAQLTSSVLGGSFQTGQVVGLSGDTVVIASANLQNNLLHIYTRPAGGWISMTESARVEAIRGSSRAEVVGDTIVWGGLDSDPITVNTNPVLRIYERTNGVWAGPTATLSAGPIGLVALLPRFDGTTVVGAVPFGSTTVFNFPTFVWTRPPGGWTDQLPDALLTTTLPGAQLLQADVSDDTIVVNYQVGDGLSAPSQHVAVYDRPEAGWSNMVETQILDAGVSWDHGVAVDGGTILSGNHVFVSSGAGVSVRIADQPDPVNAGDLLMYTVTITNDGSAPLSQVELTGTLPGDLSFVAAGPGCTHSGEPAGGLVTCALGDLGVGADVDVEIQARAGPTDVEITVETTATVTTSVASVGGTATESTRIVPAVADLEVDTFDNECVGDPLCPPVRAGDDIWYSVLVSNLGPGNATGITMVDTLPEESVFLEAASPTPGVSCAYAGGPHQVTCDLPGISAPLPPFGLILAIRVDVRVRLMVPGVAVNRAAIVALDQSDPVAANDSDVEETTVVLGGVGVTDSINAPDDALLDFGTVLIASSVQGTVRVENTGTEALAIGPALAPLQPPFSVLNPAVCFGVVLQPGASCTLIVQFQPTAVGQFSDSFDLDVGAFVVPVSVSGTGTTGAVDFRITKTVDDAFLETGDQTVFRIRIESGPGGSRVVDVVVKELMPRGFVIHDTPVADAGAFNTRSREWSVPNFAPGDMATLQIPVRLDGTHSACATNRAVATVTAPNLPTLTAEATVDVAVNRCADLAVVDITQSFDFDNTGGSVPREGPRLDETLQFFSNDAAGRNCRNGCELDFGDPFPDGLYVGVIPFHLGVTPSIFTPGPTPLGPTAGDPDADPIAIVSIRLREGSSDAFSIWAHPTLPLVSEGGARRGVIEIAFRSSELGSVHAGILDIVTTDPGDPLVSVALSANVSDAIGDVSWDVHVRNLGPGAPQEPYRISVEVPGGTAFRRLETITGDELSQSCSPFPLGRAGEGWTCAAGDEFPSAAQSESLRGSQGWGLRAGSRRPCVTPASIPTFRITAPS